MIYRVGIRNREIEERRVTAVCPRCGQSGEFSMRRIVQTFTVLWIPCMKNTAERFTVCPHCGFRYRFNAGSYQRICGSAQAGSAFQEAAEELLRGQTNAFGKYQNRSEKSWGCSAALAFFLGVLGAQHWYLGHARRAFASAALVVLTLLLFICAVLLPGEGAMPVLVLGAMAAAFNVYWGLVDAVRILTGHARDGEGAYVMSDRQYKERMRRFAEAARWK